MDFLSIMPAEFRDEFIRRGLRFHFWLSFPTMESLASNPPRIVNMVIRPSPLRIFVVVFSPPWLHFVQVSPAPAPLGHTDEANTG